MATAAEIMKRYRELATGKQEQPQPEGVVKQNPSTPYPLQDKAPTYPLRK